MLPVEQYRKTVRRPYPPLQSFLFLKGFAKADYYKPFFNEPYALTEIIVTGDAWYCSDQQLDHIGELTMKAWDTPEGLAKVKELFFERERKLLATKDLVSFGLAFEEYQPAVLMISYSEKTLDIHLRTLLKEKINHVKVEQIMSDLNSPLEDNFYKKEELDLVTSLNLSHHVKKYAGLNARYGSEKVYTLDEAQKRLQGLDKKKWIKNYHREKEELKKRILEIKLLLGNADAHWVDVVQYSVYYRTQRADVLHLSTFNMLGELKKEAKRANLSYPEILQCSVDEIINRRLPSRTEIRNRQRANGFVLEKGQIQIVTGKEYERIRDYFPTSIKERRLLTGNTAYKGQVKGPVCVVYSLQDYEKFREGDVLVAAMTTPDMVPLVKMASAVVTDEGGITCHAAIIARELKKPCIIGTKDATAILKDTMVVEVDATAGTVRVL
ncbi:MAG: hypothetical protein IPJ68_01215 [Candidatus Moraniibacteriota bacterium]|nr:MAG: hypothetical protein IPJ68_01215 [Candidatus Moranbacteria bacterium]